jgi:undecaprenyl-diphosphatase
MYIFQSIILGLVEGITEFIPVSSTGHLIIVRSLMGLPQTSGLAFDAIIQLATILAVVVYFWRDIWRLAIAFIGWVFKHKIGVGDKTMILAIIVGTIPAAILGLFLEKYMETIFRSPYFVCVGLVVGSCLFWWAESKSKQNMSLTVKKGLWSGFFQSLALFPGISRSGSTIAGGLLLGLTRESAVRLSFLLSLPIITGAGLKKFLDVWQTGQLASLEGPIIIGSLTAFISGLFAINFLIKFLRNHTLKAFAIYRVILALVVLFFLIIVK